MVDMQLSKLSQTKNMFRLKVFIMYIFLDKDLMCKYRNLYNKNIP